VYQALRKRRQQNDRGRSDENQGRGYDHEKKVLHHVGCEQFVIEVGKRRFDRYP
jgi:hypothetical protein